MSTIKHPVGPRSDKVYRRRRLVVGVGLLAAIIVIILIIVKPGSSVGEPGSPNASAKGSSTDAPSAAPTKAAAADGACDPANITVDAVTDAPDYGADQLPKLSLSLTNNGPTACVIDAGTAKQVFIVTSGEDIWWNSTDCQTGAADAKVTLAAGATQKSSVPLTWDRTRSAKDTCESDTRELAPANGASYHLSVTVDGISSKSPSQFLLN